jgi:hypothetical protein
MRYKLSYHQIKIRVLVLLISSKTFAINILKLIEVRVNEILNYCLEICFKK